MSRLSEEQAVELLRLYQHEWWTRGRRLEDVHTMLRHSDHVVGLCDGDGRLLAFARVLSDRVYKALIFDVIVVPQMRGRGLGERLLREILVAPELRGVKHFELYCLPEMVPYYEAFGFSTQVSGVVLMRRSASGA